MRGKYEPVYELRISYSYKHTKNLSNAVPKKLRISYSFVNPANVYNIVDIQILTREVEMNATFRIESPFKISNFTYRLDFMKVILN